MMKNKNIKLGVIIFTVFFAISCTRKPKSVAKPTVPPNELITTTLGGHTLKIKDFAIGEGEIKAERGHYLKVHYVAKGSKNQILHSTYKSQPYIFRLGNDEAIPAWEYGLLGVTVGTKRRLIVPSTLAYDDVGVQGLVAPNEAMTFDIEVIAISDQEIEQKAL